MSRKELESIFATLSSPKPTLNLLQNHLQVLKTCIQACPKIRKNTSSYAEPLHVDILYQLDMDPDPDLQKK